MNKFYARFQKQHDSQGFLPSSTLNKALSYAHERSEGLQAFLNAEDVPIDTNHLERTLRAILRICKNWFFARLSLAPSKSVLFNAC